MRSNVSLSACRQTLMLAPTHKGANSGVMVKSKDSEGRSCYFAFLIIDYSGVIHIFILTNDTYWDTLESLVTKEAFGDVDLMDPIYL